MRPFMALLVLASSLALAGCQTDSQYDGVSRFADTGYWDRYYGPGSPPRDG
jgi:hypothetical protein